MKKSKKMITGILSVSLVSAMCGMSAYAEETGTATTVAAETFTTSTATVPTVTTVSAKTTKPAAAATTTAVMTGNSTGSMQTTALQTTTVTGTTTTVTGIKSESLSDMIDMSATYSANFTDGDGTHTYIMKFNGSKLSVTTKADIDSAPMYNFETGKMTEENTFALTSDSITGTLKVIDRNTLQMNISSGLSWTFVNVNSSGGVQTTSTTTVSAVATTTTTVNGSSVSTGSNVSYTTTSTGSTTGGTTTTVTTGGATTTKTDSKKSDDSNKNSPKTGVAGVGMAVAGMAAALGMAFVSKKKD